MIGITSQQNELERMLLQSLYNQQEAITKVSTILIADDFLNEKNKILYEVFIATSDRFNNQFFGSADLFETAKILKKPLEFNNLDFIQELPLESPLTLARMVKQESTKHKTMNVFVETAEKLKTTSANTLELIDSTMDELNKLTEQLIEKEEKTNSQYTNELIESILHKEDEEIVETIPLFYKSLEEPLNGGFAPEKLITIGARTGIGKSVFAVNSATAACMAGRSVLFFSLEMSQKELRTRMLSSASGVILKKLTDKAKKYSLSEDEKERLIEAGNMMKEWKLTIDDEPGVTVEYIKSKSKMLANSPEGLDFIVIDYLQLLTYSGTSKNRQEQVAEFSRAMKLLAKQLKVPVLILVQLKREDKNDEEDRLPMMADIRESGAIAQDSDVIILIHRKYRDDSTDPKALFLLEKNRGGVANRKYSMRCVLEKSMFVDVTPEEEEQEEQTQIIQITKEKEEVVLDDFVDLEEENSDFAFLDEIDEEELY